MSPLISIKVNSFLNARTLLPDPAGYSMKYFVVCVGRDHPGPSPVAYLHTDSATHLFFFQKEWYSTDPIGWHWVCTDLILQEFIHQNRKEALKLLMQVFE